MRYKYDNPFWELHQAVLSLHEEKGITIASATFNWLDIGTMTNPGKSLLSSIDVQATSHEITEQETENT